MVNCFMNCVLAIEKNCNLFPLQNSVMFFIALRRFFRCMLRSILASYCLSFNICVYFYLQLLAASSWKFKPSYCRIFSVSHPAICQVFLCTVPLVFWKKEQKSENVTAGILKSPFLYVRGVYFPLDCIDMNLFSQFLLKINCRQ